MTVINLQKSFAIKQLVNQSRRLISEMGYDGKIAIVIEKNENNQLGADVVLIDKETSDRLIVNPEKMKAYYERQNLSDLLLR
jgi:hypothetical protein